MARAFKKVQKATRDLPAGEELLAGMIVAPFGFTSKLMMKDLAGVIGGLLLAPRGERPALVTDAGIAADFQEAQMWLGLTNKRLLVWSHSVMSGKPKRLIHEMPSADLTAIEMEAHKMVHAVVLRFSDGTGRLYEAPRMLNDAPAFAEAVRTR